jgi:DNA-binding XRE family transcriptional regulator
MKKLKIDVNVVEDTIESIRLIATHGDDRADFETSCDFERLPGEVEGFDFDTLFEKPEEKVLVEVGENAKLQSAVWTFKHKEGKHYSRGELDAFLSDLAWFFETQKAANDSLTIGKSFGLRVKESREAAKITLDQLSAATGISKAFLWRIETNYNDTANIGAVRMYVLAKCFGLSLDEIFGLKKKQEV